jgi:5-hydroxyisourate hydrolase
MITTHVLDTSLGRPAGGMRIILERAAAGAWQRIGEGVTDSDGRLRTLVPAHAAVEPGTYRLTFGTGAYFAARKIAGFYPEVAVTFEVAAGQSHYHVPLLLSPFGYSTYRGS